MRRQVVRAAIIVFTASFCTLVIELVAGRVLAPYVGVSLYTWTSIIGVVLAGISGGAYAGGWLADRRPQPSTLGWLLLASGLSALLIAPATTLLAADDGLLSAVGIATTLLQRVVVLSFLLFFVPSFFLGTISPVAVKLAVQNLDTAGQVVGKLYAISTLGAIAGTFVTGFYLVATFGTRATLIGVGVTLVAAALLIGDLFGRRGVAGGVALIALGVVHAATRPLTLPPPRHDPLLQSHTSGVIHTEESQYYRIEVERSVREDTGAPLHALNLDHLVHSYADLHDPRYLHYGYLRIFNEVMEWKAREQEYFRLLFVGGGGYTLPRLVDSAYPAAEIDVVEIDPAVTRVAHRFFGIPYRSSIRTVNQDARWFAMRALERGAEPYDVIFIDAFNDLSVPYHLTTRQHVAQLRRLLAPGGALVANVIDDFQNGRFLASYAKTLESVFGPGNVVIAAEGPEDLESGRSTFVVVASDSVEAIFDADDALALLPRGELARYLRDRRAIVLTDDYAPVDNMLAPLFTERFIDELDE